MHHRKQTTRGITVFISSLSIGQTRPANSTDNAHPACPQPNNSRQSRPRRPPTEICDGWGKTSLRFHENFPYKRRPNMSRSYPQFRKVIHNSRHPTSNTSIPNKRDRECTGIFSSILHNPVTLGGDVCEIIKEPYKKVMGYTP